MGPCVAVSVVLGATYVDESRGTEVICSVSAALPPEKCAYPLWSKTFSRDVAGSLTGPVY